MGKTTTFSERMQRLLIASVLLFALAAVTVPALAFADDGSSDASVESAAQADGVTPADDADAPVSTLADADNSSVEYEEPTPAITGLSGELTDQGASYSWDAVDGAEDYNIQVQIYHDGQPVYGSDVSTWTDTADISVDIYQLLGNAIRECGAEGEFNLYATVSATDADGVEYTAVDESVAFTLSNYKPGKLGFLVEEDSVDLMLSGNSTYPIESSTYEEDGTVTVTDATSGSVYEMDVFVSDAAQVNSVTVSDESVLTVEKSEMDFTLTAQKAGSSKVTIDYPTSTTPKKPTRLT